jgi:hypothetical protein
MLENMGFTVVNERTYRIVPAGSGEAERVWLHDMALERSSGGAIDIALAGPGVEAALMAQFRGLTESDRFDALVLEAGMAWLIEAPGAETAGQQEPVVAGSLHLLGAVLPLLDPQPAPLPAQQRDH